jgi:hypothetical protein
MRGFSLALAGLAACLASSAFAQNVTVTVNGTTTPATGAYTVNFYKAACDGDSNERLQSFGLVWTPALSDTLFWSTSTNCTGAQDGGSGANGLPFKAVTISTGTVNQAAIDERYLLGLILNDSNTQCDTGASGVAYVCVTQQVAVNNGLSGTTYQTLSWYMTFNYNMNPPPAPSGSCNGPCASPGESDVQMSWSYDSSSIIADHFTVYWQQDPTLTPDVDNNCVPAGTTGHQGPGLFGGDGGSDGGFGICNGCAQNSDCGGNNLCVFDQFHVPYCAENCGISAAVCTSGYGCLTETSVDGTTSGLVCVPPGNVCVPPGTPDAGQTPPDAGPLYPGVCGACAQNSDCGGNNLCVGDQHSVAYCGAACVYDAGGCLPGFTCQIEMSIGSSISGDVCVPPGNLCYPAGTLCGTCFSNSDCGGNSLCLPSDGGNYCGVDCSDAGQITCPEGTFCQAVQNVAGQNGTQCALPAGESCYNPNVSIPDAGPDAGTDAGTNYPTVDGGQVDFSGWANQSINGNSASAMLINGLTNGVCYDFIVEAFASDGTAGTPSVLVTAAPFSSQDWWRLYKQQGGADNGGWHCQAGGGGLTLASLSLLLLLRRLAFRKRTVGVVGDGG